MLYVEFMLLFTDASFGFLGSSSSRRRRVGGVGGGWEGQMSIGLCIISCSVPDGSAMADSAD